MGVPFAPGLSATKPCELYNQSPKAVLQAKMEAGC